MRNLESLEAFIGAQDSSHTNRFFGFVDWLGKHNIASMSAVRQMTDAQLIAFYQAIPELETPDQVRRYLNGHIV